MQTSQLLQPSVAGTTQLLGIIGDPVEHSLSPSMQNAAIAHLGANYIYVPFPVKPNLLSQALQGFEAIGVRGFNVTIPYKQAIVPLLQSVSDIAQAIGAVNTVYKQDDGWHGTNTDIIGFLAPLEKYPSWLTGATVVLGNGGAARAVVAGCAQRGCSAIHVVGRNPEKLQQFLESWNAPSITANLTVHQWDTLPKLLPEATLIVNTTPLGMFPNTDASPLDGEQWQNISKGCIAYDLIYTPSPTRFLQQAQTGGRSQLMGVKC